MVLLGLGTIFAGIKLERSLRGYIDSNYCIA